MVGIESQAPALFEAYVTRDSSHQRLHHTFLCGDSVGIEKKRHPIPMSDLWIAALARQHHLRPLP